MKVKTLSNLILFLLIAFNLSAFEATDQKSLDAAKQWLSLVDKGEYAKSWTNGSLTFKLTISDARWQSLMKAIREPLGNVVSRDLLEQRPSKDPAGLPKGDYMVIFFKTNFANREDAHELLTLLQESDGNWRVLTYQVQ